MAGSSPRGRWSARGRSNEKYLSCPALASIQPKSGRAERAAVARFAWSFGGRGQRLLVAAGADHLRNIMRRHVAVGRRRDTGHRRRRLSQIRRYDDDKLALVALKLLRAEQLPQDRDVAEPRDFG